MRARMQRLWPTLGMAALLAAAARAQEAVYSVEAFGATGDVASDDDTPGIQAAIDAATHYAEASGEHATVLLVGGAEYRLKTGRRGRGHLDLSCVGGGSVTLDGQGATLIVETPRLGVLFAERSSGLTIQNLVLDLDPLSHLAGTVSAVDVKERWVTVQPMEGATPLALFPDYSDEWGWLHHRTVWQRPKRGVASSFRVVERDQRGATSPARLRMREGTAMGDFEVGDVISFHYRRGNNIRLQLCEDVTLRNVVSFGAGLFFVSTSHVAGLRVERCAVLAAPGRVQATGGDGVHLKYGRDVEIRDCYFEGLSDDSVNLSSTIGFSVTGCTFVDKRRHAIVLDTDRVPYRSRTGVIAGNVMERNGGSDLYHDGGDYRTVEVRGNVQWDNNLSADVEQSYVGTLAAQDRLGWRSDGSIVFQGEGAAGEALWRLTRQATPRGHRWRVEAHASAAPTPWTYLTADEEGLRAAPSVRSWSPRRARVAPPDSQAWIAEGWPSDKFRLRHETTSDYLGVRDGRPALVPAKDALVWTLTENE